MINPETGEVNTRAVAAFVKRNEGTLERLPQLKADLRKFCRYSSASSTSA
jgi:hypothetical protein